MILPSRLLMTIKIIITCLTIGGRASVSGKDGDQLKAVVVLFRHGDRSPLSSWPTDTYFTNVSLWPDGYGQLNNLGKERQYKLGKWFRKRYDGFLPKRYNFSDIYVKSTDVDRALMSAAFNLAGLYPPNGDQVWNRHLPWQAIPIHTIPEEQDPILTTEAPCPKFDKLYLKLLNSEEFQRINRNLSNVYRNLSVLTGYKIDQLSLESFSGFFSTITIYRGLNYPLPKWTEDYWDLIKYWGAKKFQWATSTSELARLRTGPFFDYLLNYFDSVSGNNTRKFLMLSAHDTTIGDRMNALGVYPDATPEFASTIIWEIKSDINNEVYVNMYFKNSTNFDKVVVPQCQFDCSLGDLAKILKPIRRSVEEWRAECYEE